LCLTKASHLHLSKLLSHLWLVRYKRFKSTIQFSKNAPLSRFWLLVATLFRKGQGEILLSPPQLVNLFFQFILLVCSKWLVGALAKRSVALIGSAFFATFCWLA